MKCTPLKIAEYELVVNDRVYFIAKVIDTNPISKQDSQCHGG
ncbi:MAG: hypothetical protein P8N76_21885 [Pirellulaceae bacterium]|nr:hypothetical protein [Pirellulaceae bacterium]